MEGRKTRTVYVAEEPWLSIKKAATAQGRSVSNFLEMYGLSLMTGPHREVAVIHKKEMNNGFSEFWSLYPKKYAKADATKAWARLSTVERQCALERVKVYRFPAEVKFIPYAATWLNGKRWNDEEKVDPVPTQPSVLDWEKAPAHVREAREKSLRREPLTDLEAELLGDFMESHR